jgi:hypothetical protein
MFCRRECRYCENYDGDILGYVESLEDEEDEEEILHYSECD